MHFMGPLCNKTLQNNGTRMCHLSQKEVFYIELLQRATTLITVGIVSF